jgi:hypothetical protein
LRGVSLDYLLGFRDCAQSLYSTASATPPRSLLPIEPQQAS